MEKGIIVCAANVLNQGGKIIVITFHSLEDRIIKVMFKSLCDKKSMDLLNSDLGFQLINKR